MRSFYLSAFFILSLFVSTPAHAIQASTTQSSDGNIQFIFDDKVSIQVAPKSSNPAGSHCATTEKGAIRYNEHLNDIEFCNGLTWGIPGSSRAVVVDYTTCVQGTWGWTGAIIDSRRPAIGNLGSYYKDRGLTTLTFGNVNLVCPSQTVMVSTDDSVGAGDDFNAIQCCKLKLQ